jgi:hypothetical protein
MIEAKIYQRGTKARKEKGYRIFVAVWLFALMRVHVRL